MNRKTFITTSAAVSFLAIGLAVTTYLAYRPEQMSNSGDVRGIRTQASLESTVTYLDIQTESLQKLQRLLENKRALLEDTSGTQFDLKQRLDAASEVRAAFIDTKVAADAWSIPASAANAQKVFQQFLDHGLDTAESYFRYINLTAATASDTAVETDLQRAMNETYLRAQTVEQENTQTLSQAGASFEDTDSDGLADVWETIAGTDRTLADTDEDGLTDTEEFHTYLTEPRQPDTDADGFTDGIEISNGYNPLGEGRIYGIDNL